MVKDNSLIVVPPITSISAVQKIDPTLISQNITFNNGLFIINKSSLSAALPKSLYKIWKKNNKIYLIERETTNIEKIFHSICSTITSFTTQQSEGSNNVVDFIDNQGRYIITKYNNSLFLSHEYVNFNNDTNESSIRALKTINPYTKVSTLSNFEIYNNKSLNIYGLKQDLITKYLQFLKPPQIINTNLFLRLKSLFSNKEINKSYYNYFVYLFSNWGLFGLDELTSSEFDIIKKSTSIKGKLSAPLKESDLNLLNTINIINSRQVINNSTNIKFYENIRISNTTEKTDGTQTITIIDQNGDLIIGNDNNNLFLNKIFVFKNKLTNELTAIKSTNFYSINYRVDGYNKSVITAFTYNLEFIFDSTGPTLLTKEWEDSKNSRRDNPNVYDLYIYEQEQYLGFHFYDSAILELEVENSSFRTNSEGDFYVVEIV